VQLVGSVSETSALAAYHGMQKKHAAVLGADSDDCGRGFRLNAATRSD
jgi:hypothetical protein